MKNISKRIKFADKCAIITGASGNLGSCISENFAFLGFDLLLIDHPESNIKKFSNLLKKNYKSKISYYLCDFSNNKEKSKLINKIINDFDIIDVIVNNAALTGTNDILKSKKNRDLVKFKKSLEVNLTSSYEFIEGLKNLIIKSDSASIVNISSIYGFLAPDFNLYEGTKLINPLAYGVTKAGLIQMTKYYASLLGPRVRVNSVSPGGIFRDQNEIFLDRYIKKTHLKRLATEQDIVDSIIFLVSDMSRYITGQNIIIDGGYSNC